MVRRRKEGRPSCFSTCLARTWEDRTFLDQLGPAKNSKHFYWQELWKNSRTLAHPVFWIVVKTQDVRSNDQIFGYLESLDGTLFCTATIQNTYQERRDIMRELWWKKLDCGHFELTCCPVGTFWGPLWRTFPCSCWSSCFRSLAVSKRKSWKHTFIIKSWSLTSTHLNLIRKEHVDLFLKLLRLFRMICEHEHARGEGRTGRVVTCKHKNDQRPPDFL